MKLLTITIAQFLKLVEAGTINVNVAWQRREKPKTQEYIDAFIMTVLDVPPAGEDALSLDKISLAIPPDADLDKAVSVLKGDLKASDITFIFSCLNGKQRRYVMGMIFLGMMIALNTETDVDDLSFEDWTPAQQSVFLNKELEIGVYRMSEERCKIQIERMNRYMQPMTKPEVTRNSYLHVVEALADPIATMEKLVKADDAERVVLTTYALACGATDLDWMKSVAKILVEDVDESAVKATASAVKILNYAINAENDLPSKAVIAKRYCKKVHLPSILQAIIDTKVLDSNAVEFNLHCFFSQTNKERNDARLRYSAYSTSNTGGKDNVEGRLKILTSVILGDVATISPAVADGSTVKKIERAKPATAPVAPVEAGSTPKPPKP